MQDFENSKKLSSQEFIKEINENIFNWELADIVELTYAYTDLWDWKVLNRTFFEDLTWKKFNWANLDELYDLFKNKLNNKKEKIEKYINEIKNIDMQKEKKEILVWSLKYILNSIKLAILWANFEYEKAWWKLNITESEKLDIVKQMEDIEKKLYDWKVIDNPKEVKQCYAYLTNIYDKNSNILTNKEKDKFEEYLKIVKEKMNNFEVIDNKWTKKIGNKEKEKFPNILNKDIKREDYIDIFKLVFDIYWIQKSIIVDERSSIYDWEKALYIPNSEKYNTLSIKRILQLISHEIEVHFIIEKNNKQNLWNFRWGKNLNREEGTAMLSEKILLWSKLEYITITPSLTEILMWELLKWEDYEDFLKILSKLKWLKYTKAKLLRRKRNYPFYIAGVQHKDTSYSRWIAQVIDYLKSWKDPKDLFLWKVSFEGISKIKNISDIKKQNFPVLLAEILLYKLSWKKLNQKDFIKYIKEKYPFIDIDKEYKNWTVKKLTFDSKRKLVDILDILKN